MNILKRRGQVPIGFFLLKRYVNLFIKKIFGYKLSGVKKIVKHNDFDSIIKFVIDKFSNNNNKTIFDIGANLGQSIDRFQEIYPTSNIYSFEPTPELFINLNEKYSNNKKVTIYNFAISNENNTGEFYTYKYHRINSFYATDKKSKFHLSRKISAEEKNDEIFQQKIEVTTKKIDTLFKEFKLENIDILKIDTQGSEDKILEGCSSLLANNKIKIIELELILGFAYEKQLSFFDLEKTLAKYNYKLIAIKESGNLLSHSNFQTDLIYVNNDIFKEIKNLHEINKSIKNVMNRTDENHPVSY